jgi:small subunit ribosomal protein S20
MAAEGSLCNHDAPDKCEHAPDGSPGTSKLSDRTIVFRGWRNTTDMPNRKSAAKRLRQSLVRRNRNRMTKSDMRSQIRKVREAVDAGDIEKAETEYRLAARKLDRAGAHNIIHPNKAARSKSRLQHLIKKHKPAQ